MSGALSPTPLGNNWYRRRYYVYGNKSTDRIIDFTDQGGVFIDKKYPPQSGFSTIVVAGKTVKWRKPTLYHHYSTTHECLYSKEWGRDPSVYASYNYEGYKYCRVSGFDNDVNSSNEDFGAVPYLINGQLEPAFSYNERARFDTDFGNKFGEGASLGVSAATFREDIQGLAELASDVMRLIRGIKRGNLKEIRRAIDGSRTKINYRDPKRMLGKTASSRYLQYTYALTPMVQDVYDTYETLRKSEALAHLHRFRKSRKFDVKEENSSGSISGYKVLRCAVWYEVTSPEIRKASQLGLINPALVLWDLVPYSFVVDWLVPVGNYLHALSAYAGTEFKAGYLTSYAEAEVTAEGYWFYSSMKQPMTVNRYKVYHREKLSDFPTAKLHYKNPFSTKHVINAVALIRNRFR